MPRKPKEKSISTEIRIKEAAHKVFLAKGFSATTVRDVAKVAETNVALVNYYFRSKKNLFNVVMLEKVQLLLGSIVPILNNETATLEEKIRGMVNSYIDFLTKNPELITFLMNEARKENFEFIPKTQLKKIVFQSHFMKQLKERSGNINPVHFLVSLVGMIAFPFVARPMLFQTGLVKEKVFLEMMQERKSLIPFWLGTLLNVGSLYSNKKIVSKKTRKLIH